MKIKEHSFISVLILLPLTIILGLSLITGYWKANIIIYLFTGSFISFWISFIFSLFFALNEIIYSNNRKRIFLLLFIPLIYLPIYYTKYVRIKNNSFGFAPALLNIVLLIGLFFSVKNYAISYVHNKYVDVQERFCTYKR